MKSSMPYIAAAAIAAGCGFWYWSTRGEEKPTFRTLEVSRGELLVGISATGTVEPMEVVDVGAQIVGRIESFGPDPNQPSKLIDYGSKVKAEAVLAKLDESPYLAEVDKAKANMRLAKAEALRSKAQLKQADADFARAKQLKETNSKSEYDRAIASFEVAQAEAEIAQAKVEQAEIALRTAEINLGYATIKAPIDGIVIDRRVNVGQTVVAGLNAPSLFLLARNLGKMQVWAAVNEADIASIKLGQKVSFRVDAYRERTFTGEVIQIRLNAGMSNNVITYGIVVGIDNEDEALMPYMTANLQFEVARQNDCVLVPNQALRFSPTRDEITPAAREPFTTAGHQPVKTTEPTLWVKAEDGLVKPITVQAGLSDGINTGITDGELKPGMEVVVGLVRKPQKDFVSAFVSRVTGK